MKPILLTQLRQELAQFEGNATPTFLTQASACPALDALLPGQTWRRGWLVEWLAAGTGAETFALSMAIPFFERGQAIVIDRHGDFYPPAAAAIGVPLEQLTIVRPADPASELWAFEQALLCPGVSVAWLWRDKISPRDFRRLQLAAETGSTLGFLFRPWQALGQPSWSHVQLGLTPLACDATSAAASSSDTPYSTPHSPAWHFRIDLLRCRGQGASGAVEVELFGEQSLSKTTQAPRVPVA